MRMDQVVTSSTSDSVRSIRLLFSSVRFSEDLFSSSPSPSSLNTLTSSVLHRSSPPLDETCGMVHSRQRRGGITPQLSSHHDAPRYMVRWYASTSAISSFQPPQVASAAGWAEAAVVTVTRATHLLQNSGVEQKHDKSPAILARSTQNYRLVVDRIRPCVCDNQASTCRHGWIKRCSGSVCRPVCVSVRACGAHTAASTFRLYSPLRLASFARVCRGLRRCVRLCAGGPTNHRPL